MSNIILATFFLVQFLVILNYLMSSIFKNNTSFYIQIAYLYYPFIFLWGPLIYIYVKVLIKPDYRFKTIDFLHLIPFVLATIFIISYYYTADDGLKFAIVTNNLIFKYLFYFNFIYYALLFAYNFSALALLFKYQQSLKEYYSFQIKQNLVWLKFVLYGYIIACIVSAVASVPDTYISIPYDIKINILFATFLVFFNILFYRTMIQPHVLIQPEEKPKYVSSNIDISDIGLYSQKISSVLSTDKLYLNASLTLQELSKSIAIPERVISQVINQHWKQNFFSFINGYRVDEAKNLLNNFDQNRLTMLGIAYDSGFNSKSAFYDAFKKHTGMTPTEYRKLKV